MPSERRWPDGPEPLLWQGHPTFTSGAIYYILSAPLWLSWWWWWWWLLLWWWWLFNIVVWWSLFLEYIDTFGGPRGWGVDFVHDDASRFALGHNNRERLLHEFELVLQLVAGLPDKSTSINRILGVDLYEDSVGAVPLHPDSHEPVAYFFEQVGKYNLLILVIDVERVAGEFPDHRRHCLAQNGTPLLFRQAHLLHWDAGVAGVVYNVFRLPLPILLWLNAQIVCAWNDIFEPGIASVVPVQVLDLVHVIQGWVVVIVHNASAWSSRRVVSYENKLQLQVSFTVLGNPQVPIFGLIPELGFRSRVLDPIVIELLDAEVKPTLLLYIELQVYRILDVGRDA